MSNAGESVSYCVSCDWTNVKFFGTQSVHISVIPSSGGQDSAYDPA